MADTPEPTLAELQNYQTRLERELKGFRYDRRLPLDSQTQESVSLGIEKCVDQLEIIATCISILLAKQKAFAALADSDYPDLPRITVPRAVKDVLDDTEGVLDEANDQVDVEAPRAVSIEMQPGEEVDVQ